MEVSTSTTVPTVPSSLDLLERLLEYDFRENRKFMDGWNKVRDIVPQEKLLESLMKAQVFFYSREVESVDLAVYKQWLTEHNKTIPNLDSFLPVVDGCSPSSLTCMSDQAVSPEPTGHDQAVSPEPTGHDQAVSPEPTGHVGNHPVNFLELIDMIQRGVKLPDTDDLNIEPTNEAPTQSALQRPRKPWEVST